MLMGGFQKKYFGIFIDRKAKVGPHVPLKDVSVAGSPTVGAKDIQLRSGSRCHFPDDAHKFDMDQDSQRKFGSN
jgi:hypothetical protein